MMLNRSISRLAVATAASLLTVCAWSSAAVVVDVGTHHLLPNQADQAVQVSISGPDSLGGMLLNATLSGGAPAPVFQSPLPLTITGSVFDGGSADPVPGNTSDFQAWNILYSPGTTGPGTLITFMIDTTGVTSGDFTLSLSGTDLFDTQGAAVDMTLNDGTVSVPEPASVGFIGVGAILLLRRRTANR